MRPHRGDRVGGRRPAWLARYTDALLRDADRVLAATLYQFERGGASLLEVLTAQRTVDEVTIGYQEALADHARHLIALERTAGMWDIELSLRVDGRSGEAGVLFAAMSESSRSDIPSCIHWDGEHLPTELRALPPGRYELVPCEELTADQEAGIAQGFQSVAEGRGAPWSEVRGRLETRRFGIVGA